MKQIKLTINSYWNVQLTKIIALNWNKKNHWDIILDVRLVIRIYVIQVRDLGKIFSSFLL